MQFTVNVMPNLMYLNIVHWRNDDFNVKIYRELLSNNDNRILPAILQFGLNTFRPWLLCERGEGDQSFPLLLFLAFLALASKLSSLYPRGANGMSTRDRWLALEKITQLWLPLPSWDPHSSVTSVVELDLQ